MSTTAHPSVCIVGAGPYGVSIAAHLRFAGINFRIFGSPMRRWLSQMPERMLLKSESCASSLCDPRGIHTLAQFCKSKGVAYPEYGTPVSRALFAEYALSFQRTLVPDVKDVTVDAVTISPEGFAIRLRSGEEFGAAAVIVASGLDNMTYMPDLLARLPVELRSHSADYYDLSGFRGKDVIVVGGGQSALETAAILHEDGASVRLVVRKPSLVWNGEPSLGHRAWYKRLLKPRSRFGDRLGLWIYDNAPGLFHSLPQQTRLAKVRTALGPAGSWWLKDRVVGRLPVFLDQRLRAAEVRGGRIAMRVSGQNGRIQELTADHVIAATGYQFDIRNLPFLDETLKLQLRDEQKSPRLSSNFESSIPGLYFTSLGSAKSFGPAMRFLAGADYTARRITCHVARGERLRPRFAQSEKCPEF